ncbi:MAG: hypothetical protein QM597_02630 [Aeromicrobium sp.]|uniref:hypothetical protein n=1 Tax=Aeromicrobium sp. TaxID=1871063 RepID=UPI0039E320E4
MTDLDELRRRVARLEGRPVDTAAVPVHPALRGVVTPRAGGVYGVDAASLALALLAGPSAAGAWCGVVDCPDLGFAAAREFGVETERLVVVPDAGPQWWEVVAALIDTLPLVVARPPERVSQRDAARLAARLRSRQGVLVTWGAWPRCEARLSLMASQWSGLGEGHGYLRARRALVEVRSDVTLARRHEVWLQPLPGEAEPPDGTSGLEGRDDQALLRGAS